MLYDAPVKINSPLALTILCGFLAVNASAQNPATSQNPSNSQNAATSQNGATTQNPATSPIPRNPQTAPAWISRHEGLLLEAKKGGIDLLFLGDSITDNWRSKGAAVWDKY